MPIHPLPRARRKKKAPASEKAASKKAAASAAQKPRAHKDAGEKAGKAKAPRKHRAVYDDDAPLSPRPAKAKTGAKSAGKETASRQVARRVGKATMAGMKRFNAFSYSQGDGKRRVFRIPLTFRFFILASFIIIFLMLLALNNQSVSVDEETIAIAGLPSALENYRILHISDLHAAEFGAEQSTLLRTVNNLDYDIMLITGDMVGASGNAEPFLNFLRGLSTCRNVYFIAGDSDPGPLPPKFAKRRARLINACWKTGCWKPLNWAPRIWTRRFPLPWAPPTRPRSGSPPSRNWASAPRTLSMCTKTSWKPSASAT